MLKLFKNKKAAVEAHEAENSINEMMGVEVNGNKSCVKSMYECLLAVTRHAGVTLKNAEVYMVRKGRLGKRSCYVFRFKSGGKKYDSHVDIATGEVLRFCFQPV